MRKLLLSLTVAAGALAFLPAAQAMPQVTVPAPTVQAATTLPDGVQTVQYRYRHRWHRRWHRRYYRR